MHEKRDPVVLAVFIDLRLGEGRVRTKLEPLDRCKLHLPVFRVRDLGGIHVQDQPPLTLISQQSVHGPL
jgi:hypothetical protein